MEVPSPFAPYLKTNYAVTGDEAKTLEAFLAQPMAKLAELKEELKTIQNRYDAVQQQCDALSQHIDDHRALIAPIRQLPIDVVQEIFIWCLPHEHNAIMAQDECPVLLTRICSSWRQVALKTPALWTSIHIPIPRLNYDPPNSHSPSRANLESPSDPMDIARRRSQGVTQWLNRSGSSTLDITICSCEPPSTRAVYDIVLEALLPFSQQLGSLKFQLPVPGFLSRLASHLFPRLHSLSMSGRAQAIWLPANYPHPEISLLRDESNQTFWRNSNILLSPNLRNITYNTFFEDPDDFFGFPLRWETLTSLSLNGTLPDQQTPDRTVEKIISMLMACHHLQYLHLETGLSNPFMFDAPPMTRASPHASMITLPHLSELVVEGFIHPLLGRLFDLLEVPKLEICHISRSVSVFPFVLDFLTRTANTLRKVNANPTLFTKDEFFNFVSLCERLVELELTLNEGCLPAPNVPQRTVLEINDEFLGELLGTHTSIETQLYLPLLSTFRCHPGSEITEGCVLKIVKARNAYIEHTTSGIAKPLRNIDILFSFPQTIPILEELNKLQEEGIICQFDFPYHPPTNKTHFNSTRQGLPSRRSPDVWVEHQIY